VSDGTQESGAALEFNIIEATSTSTILELPHTPNISRWEELSVYEGGWGYISSDVISASTSTGGEMEYIVSVLPHLGDVEVLNEISGGWRKLEAGEAFTQSKVLGKFVR